jgi:hypothetical protein
LSASLRVSSEEPDDATVTVAQEQLQRPSDAAARTALAVFVAVEAFAFGYLVYLGRSVWFTADEWDFVALRTAWNLDDLFRPHNEHWSTLPILLYRLLWWLFGLRTHLPHQMLVAALHLTVAALLYAVMRRARIAPWIATIAASAFALFGTGYFNIVYAFQVAWCFSLACGLAYLLLVDHDGRFDRRDWLGLGLGLAGLMSSGVGVSMIIVVATAALLRRGWRLAALHAVPLATVFLLWLAVIGRSSYGERATLTGALRFMVRNQWATVRGIGHSPIAGVALVVVLVVGVVLAWRRGAQHEGPYWVPPAATFVGAVAFLFITGTGRAGPEGLFPLNVSRYLYVAAALALPAFAYAANEIVQRAPRLVPVVAVILLVGVPGNFFELRDAGHKMEAASLPSRRFILSVPRNPVASQLPRSLQPWGFANYLELGWLLDSVPSGRVPAPRPLTPQELASQTLSLAFRPDAHAPSARCRSVRTTVVRVLRKNDSLRLASGRADVVLLAYGAQSVPVPLRSTPSRALVDSLRLRIVPRPGSNTPVVCG